MLSIGTVVLGVSDIQRAADFWSGALGYEPRQDLNGYGMALVPPGGAGGTRLALQRSGTPPQDHPRIHLDLFVSSAAEQAQEADRLVSLGARRVDWDMYPDDPDFVVLADPEGNLFCIVDTGHPHR